MRACVRVRECVRACVRACVRVCVCVELRTVNKHAGKRRGAAGRGRV